MVALWILSLSAIFVPLGLAQAREFDVLHVFNGGSDGGHPYGGLVMDKVGNLYGTAYDGNTVFRLSPDGAETILHSFAGPPKDGWGPRADLIIDKKGNLYGTTGEGGSSKSCAEFGCGTVFKITADGKETLLYSFDPANGDGSWPNAGVVADSEGNLYGTTFFSGLSEGCCGTVFKITSKGNATILHSFTGYPDDGSYPWGDLVVDSSGNLYGTTLEGGASGSCGANVGCGTVFKITPDGTESVLHSFSGNPDGCQPYSGLVLDKTGTLYGTTAYGGAGYGCGGGYGGGTVFKLASDGTETVLHTFGGGSDGYQPYGALIADKAGDFYGTTFAGGTTDNGTVFKLSPEGTETVLHSFNKKINGRRPFGRLLKGTSGYLFGTTLYGGEKCIRHEPYGCGTVFKLKR